MKKAIRDKMIAEGLDEAMSLVQEQVDFDYGKDIQAIQDKLIRFAIGAGLDLDETQTLLKHAKYAPLYARNKRDGVIIYAINNKKSSVDCDILLSETGEEPLE